jgi:hypothetical protein
MTVFISFDRFVYVHYSGGRRLWFMRDRKSLIATLVTMFLVIALIDTEKFFFKLVEKNKLLTSKIYLSNNGTDAGVSSGARICVSVFKNYAVSELIAVSLRIHIPIVLMFIFNIMLVYKLLKSKSRISLRNHRKEAQFTFSVLFSSVAYLVLYTPIAILFGLKHYYMLSGQAIEKPIDERDREIFNFLYELSVNFSLIFETFLFFIIMATNKVFRSEVWTVLRVKKPRAASLKVNNKNLNEAQSIQLVTNNQERIVSDVEERGKDEKSECIN